VPRRAAAVIAAVLTAALSLTLSVSARADDSDMATAHWAARTVVVRDETGFADYHRAIEQAVNQWNAAAASIQLQLAGGLGRGCENPQGAEIPVCRSDLSGNRAGETRLWFAGGHVDAASVLMDASPHPFDQLVAIACHELGHALGLDHDSRASSCLTPTIGSTTPDDQDRHDLRVRYDHVHADGHPAEHSDSCMVRAGVTCLSIPPVVLGD
jgi:hypothetical protein